MNASTRANRGVAVYCALAVAGLPALLSEWSQESAEGFGIGQMRVGAKELQPPRSVGRQKLSEQ
jgi:hypothetical protein